MCVSVSFSFGDLTLVPLLTGDPGAFIVFLVGMSGLQKSGRGGLSLSASPMVAEWMRVSMCVHPLGYSGWQFSG